MLVSSYFSSLFKLSFLFNNLCLVKVCLCWLPSSHYFYAHLNVMSVSATGQDLSPRKLFIYIFFEYLGEWAHRIYFHWFCPLAAISVCLYICIYVCPLGVTFDWRGMETSHRKGASLNFRTRNWFFLVLVFGIFLTLSISNPPAASWLKLLGLS